MTAIDLKWFNYCIIPSSIKSHVTGFKAVKSAIYIILSIIIDAGGGTDFSRVFGYSWF